MMTKALFLPAPICRPDFLHLLGYVSYPTQDKSGNYWQGDFIGKDGLEKEYNDELKGRKWVKNNRNRRLGKNIFGKYC